MDRRQIEEIYDTLFGVMEAEAGMAGVENAFARGTPCERWYKEMGDAYLRLCDRLGVEDEDEDVEVIVNSLLAISRELGLQLFEYGLKFAEKI